MFPKTVEFLPFKGVYLNVSLWNDPNKISLETKYYLHFFSLHLTYTAIKKFSYLVFWIISNKCVVSNKIVQKWTTGISVYRKFMTNLRVHWRTFIFY